MKSLVERFVETLKEFGLEYFGRYYGVYRGIVEDNIDPDQQGKIYVQVPALCGNNPLPNPAYPIAPFAGADFGMYFPPPIGETIYVEFEGGDIDHPLYRGGWWKAPDNTPELPEEFRQDDATTESPVRRGIKTPGGHKIIFDDTEDDEQLLIAHSSKSNVYMNKDGSISMFSSKGAYVTIDAAADEVSIVDKQGNSLKMSASGIDLIGQQNIIGIADKLVQIISQKDFVVQCAGINLNAGGVVVGANAVEPAVLGSQLISYIAQLLTWMATHTHPTTSPGSPTAPPVGPPPNPPPTLLSKNVKVL